MLHYSKDSYKVDEEEEVLRQPICTKRNERGATPAPRFSKIGASASCDAFNEEEATASGLRFIDIEILRNFLEESAVCKKYGKGELQSTEHIDGRSGLACTINVCSNECGEKSSFQPSKWSQRGMFEVNEGQFVYALRTCGKGLLAGHVICTVMNMPLLPTKWSASRSINWAFLTRWSKEHRRNMKKCFREHTENARKCMYCAGAFWTILVYVQT